MPEERKYHNLMGWIRDITHAVRTGHEAAYIVSELLLQLEDLIDSGVESALPDPSGVGESNDDDDVATAGQGVGGATPLHDGQLDLPVGGSRGLVPKMVGHALATDLARAAAGLAAERQSGTVGRTPLSQTFRGLTGGET